MAIFGNKENKKKEKAPKRATFARAAKLPHERANEIIRHPWFTEKALVATDRGVYVFAVSGDSTKSHIAAAIKELYGVAPRKVRIVNMPAKRVSTRTGRGKALRARRRKAYVYLNTGDKIDFA